MIDPWIELAGWVVAQAIEDACGGDNATSLEKKDALRFLRKDPIIDHILDCFDYGTNNLEDKRAYILKMVIPERKKMKKLKRKLYAINNQ